MDITKKNLNLFSQNNSMIQNKRRRLLKYLLLDYYVAWVSGVRVGERV